MNLFEIENLSKTFYKPVNYFYKDTVHALTDVNLVVYEGECLGIIGESGSGKTTLARSLMRLIEIDRGSILYRGINLHQLSYQEMRSLRPDLQIIFQDPGQSLNPRQTVYSCLLEAINSRKKLLKHECLERMNSLCKQVKLAKTILSSLPAQLSGGQKQRVAIARALASNPKLIIADEPTSSLDAPIKQEILDLLIALKKNRNLTLILITHDLRVAAQITDRLVILYKGRIVESGNTRDIINSPSHPYTNLLLSVVNATDNKHVVSWEYQPDSIQEHDNFETPCSYYSDCPIREKECLTSVPRLRLHKSNCHVACHRIFDVKGRLRTTELDHV